MNVYWYASTLLLGSSGGLPGSSLTLFSFFPGQCPPLCGLLANNFERMPAAALRDLDSKRGVSLLSTHGKNTATRSPQELSALLVLPCHTQGTAKGIGCMTQIFGFSQLVANRWLEGRRVIGIAIDLKKAFDTIDHRVLKASLKKRRRNILGRLLCAIMGKYQKPTC